MREAETWRCLSARYTCLAIPKNMPPFFLITTKEVQDQYWRCQKKYKGRIYYWYNMRGPLSSEKTKAFLWHGSWSSMCNMLKGSYQRLMMQGKGGGVCRVAGDWGVFLPHLPSSILINGTGPESEFLIMASITVSTIFALNSIHRIRMFSFHIRIIVVRDWAIFQLYSKMQIQSSIVSNLCVFVYFFFVLWSNKLTNCLNMSL